MKREILDSNIYGKIIEKMDINFVLDKLPSSNIIIYGRDAIKSYELVNIIKKLKTPKFKSYEEFKNEISKK